MMFAIDTNVSVPFKIDNSLDSLRRPNILPFGCDNSFEFALLVVFEGMMVCYQLNNALSK